MKNEIPAIDTQAEEVLATLNEARDTIDKVHHESERMTTEQYAHLCELLYMASERLWTIRSMTQDHHCNVNPSPTRAELRAKVVDLAEVCSRGIVAQGKPGPAKRGAS